MQLKRYHYETRWPLVVGLRTWLVQDTGYRLYKLRINGEEIPLYDGKEITREKFENTIDALVPPGGEVDEYFPYLYGAFPFHPKRAYQLIASYRAEV